MISQAIQVNEVEQNVSLDFLEKFFRSKIYFE